MSTVKKIDAYLIGMLTPEASDALMRLCGRQPTKGEITEDTIEELEREDLARRDVNLMDKKPVLLLTPRGKRIAQLL